VGGAGTGVKVDRMRYGDARQVAVLLNQMFVGGASSGLDAPMNQLAPGGGAVASRSAPQPGGSLAAQQPAAPPAAGGSIASGSRYASTAGSQLASNTAPAQTAGYGRDVQYGGAGGGGAPTLPPGGRVAAGAGHTAPLVFSPPGKHPPHPP